MSTPVSCINQPLTAVSMVPQVRGVVHVAVLVVVVPPGGHDVRDGEVLAGGFHRDSSKMAAQVLV